MRFTTGTVTPPRTDEPGAHVQSGRTFHECDWETIAQALHARGSAVLRAALTGAQCDELSALYADDAHFRKTVVMARHGFGSGEYKYFRYELPPLVQELRAELYEHLAPVANAWNELLGAGDRFPAEHEAYLRTCRAGGQSQPTPLMLTYGEGDYNCLHQDLYGDLVFPIQVALLLSEPDVDFGGGEFVLTEQRPRMQSRPEVVSLRKGDAVAFAVHRRPVRGTRGAYRVNMRHGVSRLHWGTRRTLGIIFHDARS